VFPSKSACPQSPRARTGQATTTTGLRAPKEIAEARGAVAEARLRPEASWTISCGKKDSRTTWGAARIASTLKMLKIQVCVSRTETALTNTFSHAKYVKENICTRRVGNCVLLQGNPEAKPAKMLPDCPTSECARNVGGLDFDLQPLHLTKIIKTVTKCF